MSEEGGAFGIFLVKVSLSNRVEISNFHLNSLCIFYGGKKEQTGKG